MNKAEFHSIIYTYYRKNKRDFPFRETTDPYKIFVSEIMLQQTQISRVVPKYETFISLFPDFPSLAAAPLADIFNAWKGLGYNRRAKYLRESSRIILTDYGGIVPKEPKTLETFPGIGKATARSIPAFAFNIPTVFIEVNIRRVFLHFFFSDRDSVRDLDIMPVVEEMLDTGNPREWYYALMDYGTALKSIFPDLSKKSRHYVKQKPFEGSNRQLRGKILAHAAGGAPFSASELGLLFGREGSEIAAAAAELVAEGFLMKRGEIYTISQ